MSKKIGHDYSFSFGMFKFMIGLVLGLALFLTIFSNDMKAMDLAIRTANFLPVLAICAVGSFIVDVVLNISELLDKRRGLNPVGSIQGQNVDVSEIMTIGLKKRLEVALSLLTDEQRESYSLQVSKTKQELETSKVDSHTCTA